MDFRCWTRDINAVLRGQFPTEGFGRHRMRLYEKGWIKRGSLITGLVAEAMMLHDTIRSAPLPDLRAVEVYQAWHDARSSAPGRMRHATIPTFRKELKPI